MSFTHLAWTLAVVEVELVVDDGESFRVGDGLVTCCRAIGAETAVLRRVFRRVGDKGIPVLSGSELESGSSYWAVTASLPGTARL